MFRRTSIPCSSGLSRGRISTIAVTPVVLLTHTGARSGTRRTTPLIYFTDHDRVILIASNYGSSHHPAWYHNVKANPEVTLSARGFQGPFIGTEVTGAERDRLWALATGWLAGYLNMRLDGGYCLPCVAFPKRAVETRHLMHPNVVQRGIR
jgi:deazaflavin-dependent oxidoreductase (nitroreductase family)